MRPGETTSNVAVWFQMGDEGVPMTDGSPSGSEGSIGRSVCEFEGRRGGGLGGRTSTLARLAMAGGLASAVDRFELKADEIGVGTAVELDEAAERSEAPPTTRRLVTSPLPLVGASLRRTPFFFCCSLRSSGGGAPHSRETELRGREGGTISSLSQRGGRARAARESDALGAVVLEEDVGLGDLAVGYGEALCLDDADLERAEKLGRGEGLAGCSARRIGLGWRHGGGRGELEDGCDLWRGAGWSGWAEVARRGRRRGEAGEVRRRRV